MENIVLKRMLYKICSKYQPPLEQKPATPLGWPHWSMDEMLLLLWLLLLLLLCCAVAADEMGKQWTEWPGGMAW